MAFLGDSNITIVIVQPDRLHRHALATWMSSASRDVIIVVPCRRLATEDDLTCLGSRIEGMLAPISSQMVHGRSLVFAHEIVILRSIKSLTVAVRIAVEVANQLALFQPPDSWIGASNGSRIQSPALSHITDRNSSVHIECLSTSQYPGHRRSLLSRVGFCFLSEISSFHF